MFNGKNLSLELLLTTFKNNISTDIKLSKTQVLK